MMLKKRNGTALQKPSTLAFRMGSPAVAVASSRRFDNCSHFRQRLEATATIFLLTLSIATAALVQENPGQLAPAEIQALEQQAAQGNAETALRLGMLYLEGRQVLQDAVKSEAWLRKARDLKHKDAPERLAQLLLATSNEGRDVPRAAEGLEILRNAAKTNPDAHLALGAFSAQGRFVKQSFADAEDHFLAATKQGSAKAWFDLGLLHSGELGFAEKIRPKEAVLHLEKAFADGYLEAGRVLVKLLQEGTRVPKNEVRAFEILVSAADKGNADARFALGEAYEKGLGVAADPAKAFDAFKQAAEAGNPSAQTKLGLLHGSGTGGAAKDLNEAKKWFERAVEKGFSPAALNLALLLDPDAGTGSAEERRAVELLVAAAASGLTDAQDRLGSWYRDGKHVVRDLNAARAWFLAAANAGNLAAKINLAQVLELPPAQPEALQTALKLYVETAEAGHPVGHFHLARMLISGVLGQIDPVTAWAHLSAAKDAGLERAAKPLGELEARLTPEQKAQAAEVRKTLRSFPWKE